MKLKNRSNKIIGIGNVTVLPGETQEIPAAYETSPVLEVYKKAGFAEISGEPEQKQKTDEEITAEKEAAEKKAADDAEKLRQTRLAALEGISDEELGRMANELGINPAECKDQADVLKKVKAVLKK